MYHSHNNTLYLHLDYHIDGQPPVDPHNDIPMDPDVNMPGPPLVPDDDPHNDQDDLPPDDPMDPPAHPPGFPPDNTQPPDTHPALPPRFTNTITTVSTSRSTSSWTSIVRLTNSTYSYTTPPDTIPLEPLPANAFIPSAVVPPNITDTHMHHSIKHETTVPVSSPTKKANAPAPGNQMLAPSGSSSRNHLWGDVPVSISQTSSKPKDDKPYPTDPDEDDETDPQAGPSSGPPILPIDDDATEEAVNVPVPNDDKSDTAEYHSSPEGITDSDDTVEYQDLVIDDDESWSLLTEEQKLCSNTGSFSVPRYIDNSPVDVTGVRLSNSYQTSLWTYRGQNNVRKNYSEITELYDNLAPEDSAYMTLYQSLDKSSLLGGKKRKEATQQERRDLAKQFF